MHINISDMPVCIHGIEQLYVGVLWNCHFDIAICGDDEDLDSINSESKRRSEKRKLSLEILFWNFSNDYYNTNWYLYKIKLSVLEKLSNKL